MPRCYGLEGAAAPRDRPAPGGWGRALVGIVPAMEDPGAGANDGAAVVVLTGAAGELGDRVRSGLLAHAASTSTDLVVVRYDAEDEPDVEPGGRVVVVDLGSSDYDRRAARRESSTTFAAQTLSVADRLRAQQVVFVSSAMVYGAMANNPVPLTEEATLRPDVEFVFARQLASAEELVEQWRVSQPGRATCVLRPAVSLAAGGDSRLASALVSGFGRRLAEADPPSQYLHLDDLASAVVLAVTATLDGVYNVAPDGWVAGERVRALSGERPRLPLPERLGELVSGLRWRFQRGPIPPGLLSYTRESWVVANGRLRAEGWTPTVTNEQTYVESTEAPWWTMVSPKRRQELALGAGVVAAVVAGLTALVVIRRRITRRRG
jgi:nucleoside-diphosphate-sugar epimerase